MLQHSHKFASNILLPQVNNEFQPNKEPTIGAAFLTQKCRLEDRVLRYEIWDTAGQERFHSLAVCSLHLHLLCSSLSVYEAHVLPQRPGGRCCL